MIKLIGRISNDIAHCNSTELVAYIGKIEDSVLHLKDSLP